MAWAGAQLFEDKALEPSHFSRMSKVLLHAEAQQVCFSERQMLEHGLWPDKRKVGSVIGAGRIGERCRRNKLLRC